MPDTDAARFTRLYEDNYARVLAYALRRAPRELAKEAVDEAFLIAWRRLPDVPHPPLPWLLVVARNVVSQQYRTDRRADALATELNRLAVAPVGEDVSALVTERTTVLQAVAGLSDTDREALVLTVWDGLSAREAASVTGCSTGTFAVRLHRARRRLRAALDLLDARESAVQPIAVQEAR